jgi:hypothetical protein
VVVFPLRERGSFVLSSAVSMVSIGPQGHHDRPARDPRALASAGLRRYWRWKSGSLGGRPQNHAPDIAAIDLFVVPTIGFDLVIVAIPILSGLHHQYVRI